MTDESISVHSIHAAYSRRNFRERALICMAVLALAYLLAEATVGSWFESKRLYNQSQIKQLQMDSARLQTELQLFSSNELEKNNRQQRQLIQLLAQQLDDIDAELGPLQKQELDSTELLALVKKMASQADSINLLEIKILPREIAEIDIHHLGAELEKHQLELHLQGDYLSMAKFVRSVESSGWPIFWESMVYRLTQYPEAEMLLRLYTLRDENEDADNLSIGSLNR